MEHKEYASLYIAPLIEMTKSLTGAGFRFLLILMRDSDMPSRLSKKHADSSGNAVFINPENKKAWAEELDMTPGTLNNLVTELQRRELILKRKSMIYILNPEYVFKGTWVQRQEAVQELINERTQKTS